LVVFFGRGGVPYLCVPISRFLFPLLFLVFFSFPWSPCRCFVFDRLVLPNHVARVCSATTYHLALISFFLFLFLLHALCSIPPFFVLSIPLPFSLSPNPCIYFVPQRRASLSGPSIQSKSKLKKRAREARCLTSCSVRPVIFG